MAKIEISRLGFSDDPKTGWSVYPFTGCADNYNIKGVHVVAIKPGQLRGNHYHERTDELLLIFSGRGLMYWEEDGQLRQEELVGFPPLMVRIPKGVRHAFRNIGEETVHLLAVREGESGSGKPDIVRSEFVKA